MSIIKEFKGFILKGSVVNLAIAVIIGAAFGAIITSLVDDIITPLLLAPALKAAGAEDISKLTWGAVKYGNFLAAVIKFVVIAAVLFALIKAATKMSKKAEEVSASPSYTDVLLTEIRDELKRR
ncbi:MAG: large conductance mechanosensitive channel protein MscL [Ferruginibacter sp.]|nr:large conductance mechanosensitive channel protein MscL [Ferruginibacter sp.]